MRISLFFLLLLLLMTSCGDDKPQRILDRPSLKNARIPIKIEVQNHGAIIYGDTLIIKVSSAVEDHEVKTFNIAIDDKEIISAASGIAKIPGTTMGGGDIRLKITAEMENGESSLRYKEIKVVASEKPVEWEFQVVKKYPHDPKSFTQGFLVHDGFLYEGTGNYGESRLRKMDLTTGKVLQEKELESDYFGEGITILNGNIYELTYKASRGFVYDLATFERKGEFNYSFETDEGWGLTSNDTSLIASDGSANIYFLNPNTFKEQKRLRVFDENGDVDKLNELEYYRGVIYANIYTTAKIVAFDATTGQVLDNYTARGVVEQADITSNMDVLNGIAINPANGNFLLTGKYWGKIYEVRPKAPASLQ